MQHSEAVNYHQLQFTAKCIKLVVFFYYYYYFYRYFLLETILSKILYRLLNMDIFFNANVNSNLITMSKDKRY